MHYLEMIIDNELIDIVPFCSDWCHNSYCVMHGIKYEGWNGCHEGGDNAEFCAYCSEEIHGDKRNDNV